MVPPRRTPQLLGETIPVQGTTRTLRRSRTMEARIFDFRAIREQRLADELARLIRYLLAQKGVAA
jgi:hypothetical protein